MEKPGISAYNKLKGSVMEFGYVTESGDKIRVRSMPADGLGPVDIRKHLDYVEREYAAEGKRQDQNKFLYDDGLKNKKPETKPRMIKRLRNPVNENTHTHYTRRETLKQKLLEAIRSYGVE